MVKHDPEKSLTDLLNELPWDGTNRELAYQLVYPKLKEIASKVLSSRADAQMSSSDLLHTVYVQKLRTLRVPLQNRQHFYALAARAMKQVVLDEWRSRKAAKRSKPDNGAPIWNWGAGEASINPETFALVNPLLDKLTLLDPQAARVVELRIVLGFTLEEIADILGVKLKAVREDWDFAKEWLRGKLGN